MKHVAVVCLLLFLPAVRAAQTPALPAYLVRFASGPIRPDGKMDEAAWSDAEWSRDFVWIDAGDAAPVRSRFKALYGREALHFGFEFESPAMAAVPLDPDFPRACEVFLDPEGRGGRYLEFAVAPDGAQHAMIWNGRLSVREWKGEQGPAARVGITRSAAGTGKERLVYEVSFPWKALAQVAGGRAVPPARGDAWRANFSRVEQGEVGGDYVWASAGFYYMHHPNTFGWLVFAGDKDPLRAVPADTLKPLPDRTEEITGNGHFALFSRTYWTRFPLLPAGGGDWYAVSKCSVTRLDADGRPRFTRMRKDGLPQFIRSVAGVADRLYVAGNGVGEGLYLVDDKGHWRRVTREEGYTLERIPVLLPLDRQRCLAAVEDQFQLVSARRLQLPIRAGGKVLCAAALGEGGLAVGTTAGFELYAGEGKLVQRTAVAGGISAAAVLRGAAVGFSGKNGLYRMDDSGTCTYFPSPLRIKFDALMVDARDRCWAAYQGGVVLVEGGKARLLHEPLGLAGFQVLGMAATRSGKVVFLASLPSGTWYRSSPHERFLLVYDGTNWRQLTFGDGLPGHVEALASIDGQVYLSTSAGVFRFRE